MSVLGLHANDSWQVDAEAADLVRPAIIPIPVYFEALPKPVTIDLARTALLIVDMQNDFCHPAGWLASIGVDTGPACKPIAGFWDTALDSILRNLGLTTLLFVGVNLGQSVPHTMADASFLGYDTLLLEDCAATTNPTFCRDATLLNIRQSFGFTLLSHSLIEALSA